jgi:hypothetical protein
MKEGGAAATERSLIWKDVLDFANEFAGDLAKFLIVLVGLLVVAFIIRLVKIAGFIEVAYVEWFEKLDFLGNLALILQLILDFNLRFFDSVRRRRANETKHQQSFRR